MTYKETLNWMFAQLPMYQREGKIAFKKDLTNTLALSKELNFPEKKFKSIHVGGTNGKGSTSHMLASILQEAGYKVGLYTSPHLKSFTERIRINGKEIPKRKVSSFIKKNKLFLEKQKLSFFEMTVGMAFDYFADENVWDSSKYKEAEWPTSFLVSMPISKKTTDYSQVMSIVSYMDFEEVKAWENTFNIDSVKNDRGETYNEWKSKKELQFIDRIEEVYYPNIRKHIIALESSTPLTYRDYIGNDRGSAYGYVKDINNPLKSFISPKSKIKNLLFTGQSLNMHGILGVTISAVTTCSEILGKDYLLQKIVKANTQEEVS